MVHPLNALELPEFGGITVVGPLLHDDNQYNQPGDEWPSLKTGCQKAFLKFMMKMTKILSHA